MKHPSELDFNYKCRTYANAHGYYGEIGGWIYHYDRVKPVCQGWANFYKSHGKRIEAFMLDRYNRRINNKFNGED